VRISSLDTPGLAMRVAIEEDRAYVADNYAGVQVLDIRSPSLITGAGAFDIGAARCYDVTVRNKIAYLAYGDSGIVAVDFENVSEPVLLGSSSLQDPGFLARSLYVEEAVVTAAASCGIIMVDFSNPRFPLRCGWQLSPSSSEGICRSTVGQFALIAEYAAGLSIRRLSDLSVVGSAQVEGLQEDVISFQHTAYLANFNNGISVIDISDVVQPMPMETIPLQDDIWSLSIFTNRLYACVDDAGLIIFDISSPESPQQLGTFRTPGPARGVAVREYK
jgi:hypothetical protein